VFEKGERTLKEILDRARSIPHPRGATRKKRGGKKKHPLEIRANGPCFTTTFVYKKTDRKGKGKRTRRPRGESRARQGADGINYREREGVRGIRSVGRELASTAVIFQGKKL